LIAGLVLIYFLPTMIGIIRKLKPRRLLIFLNVLSSNCVGHRCRSAQYAGG
jgi:hypothetical protein